MLSAQMQACLRDNSFISFGGDIHLELLSNLLAYVRVCLYVCMYIYVHIYMDIYVQGNRISTQIECLGNILAWAFIGK